VNFRTRKMIMPGNLNPANALFGGQALAWIDEEAAIFATCQLGDANIVTKFMSAIDFRAPARQGDLIEIGTDLVKFGRTSITVTCAMRNKTTKEEILRVETIVFVLLDEHGIPKVHGITELRPEEA
jgi:acyl-CoA thioesterase YciA